MHFIEKLWFILSSLPFFHWLLIARFFKNRLPRLEQP